MAEPSLLSYKKGQKSAVNYHFHSYLLVLPVFEVGLMLLLHVFFPYDRGIVYFPSGKIQTNCALFSQSPVTIVDHGSTRPVRTSNSVNMRY